MVAIHIIVSSILADDLSGTVEPSAAAVEVIPCAEPGNVGLDGLGAVDLRNQPNARQAQTCGDEQKPPESFHKSPNIRLLPIEMPMPLHFVSLSLIRMRNGFNLVGTTRAADSSNNFLVIYLEDPVLKFLIPFLRG